jgi:hypothetical protein
VSLDEVLKFCQNKEKQDRLAKAAVSKTKQPSRLQSNNQQHQCTEQSAQKIQEPVHTEQTANKTQLVPNKEQIEQQQSNQPTYNTCAPEANSQNPSIHCANNNNTDDDDNDNDDVIFIEQDEINQNNVSTIADLFAN